MGMKLIKLLAIYHYCSMTYKELKQAALDRYPDDKSIWERVAFVNGAMYFMRHVCPEKEPEMDVNYVTMD